jgi:hypothetical protein
MGIKLLQLLPIELEYPIRTAVDYVPNTQKHNTQGVPRLNLEFRAHPDPPPTQCWAHIVLACLSSGITG